MKYIIISGIDGSGKTSIINELIRRLEEENYATKYIWMRFNHYLVKVMNALARVLKLSVPLSINEKWVWQHQFHRSPLFCRMYVVCSYIDNRMARIKIKNIQAEYVICDRWVADTLVDLGAECRWMDILEGKWYERFVNLLPPESMQFVIVRKFEDILESRAENRQNPDFPSRFELYKKLSGKEGVITIDNSGTIEQSVEKILKFISNE